MKFADLMKVSVAALIGAMKDVPLVNKELEHGNHSNYSANSRYSGQPYSIASDRSTDTEAQTT